MHVGLATSRTTYIHDCSTQPLVRSRSFQKQPSSANDTTRWTPSGSKPSHSADLQPLGTQLLRHTTMFLERFALVAILVLSGTWTQAFSVGRPSSSVSRVPAGSTCLRAEASEGEAPEEPKKEEPKSAEAAATDILNSPAFLTRKLDVIKSDIAKVEEDMEAAKQRLEAGRAEWGSQFDDLRKEVRSIL